MEKMIVTVRNRIENKPDIDVELPGEKAFRLFKGSLIRLLRGGKADSSGSFYYHGSVLPEDQTLTESMVHDGSVLELR